MVQVTLISVRARDRHTRMHAVAGHEQQRDAPTNVGSRREVEVIAFKVGVHVRRRVPDHLPELERASWRSDYDIVSLVEE